MIEINQKKFAETPEEFNEECVGFARRLKREIVLENREKERIGVINQHGILCKATKRDGGYWYNFGEIEELGKVSYSESVGLGSKYYSYSEWSGNDRIYVYK